MLVQVADMPVPGHDAYYRYAALRSTDCAISIVWSSGLATDWGVQSRLVEYIAKQKRTQLSIVLEGHGYVVLPAGPVQLGPGDVVELDQRRQDEEGYGGSPCVVLVVDWDDGGRFGPERRGSPRCSRLSAGDVARLRSLTSRVTTTPGELWVRELVEDLRAVGLPAPEPPGTTVVAPTAARLFGALGTARGQIDRHVSMTELAEELGLSDRHIRRGFAELETKFGMTTAGWRHFLCDARLSRAQQLLSVRGLPLKRVAELSGFRSVVALSHAFSARAENTPGEVARLLRERWQ